MDLYKNKFRITSTRLREWDYSTPAWYYVTICTKNMKHWFGEIKNDEMVLNDAGKIVETLWNTIPDHYKSTELDAFVIMPNHIHGIIILGSVETGHAPSLLGNVVGSFKSAVSKYLRGNMNLEFNWQPRFYDHIIRNENDLIRIRTYIKNNPLKWVLDKYYSKE